MRAMKVIGSAMESNLYNGADSQPDNCCGGQNCAVLGFGANNREMTDQSCGTDLYPFLREILKGPLQTTSSTTTTTTATTAVPTVTTTIATTTTLT